METKKRYFKEENSKLSGKNNLILKNVIYICMCVKKWSDFKQNFKIIYS